jgi:hypothetical protein
METETPPCTEMDSVGSEGGVEMNTELGALFDSYRIRLDRWRRYHLIRVRRWGVLYYLLLSVSIICSTGAGVIVANFQSRSQSDGITIKWLGVTLTLMASVCSSLLAALHPVTQQQRARDRAGIAIKLRGKIFVFLSRYASMDSRERLMLQESIVDGYSKFIEGGSQQNGNSSNNDSNTNHVGTL